MSADDRPQGDTTPLRELTESQAGVDPLALFARWYGEAVAAGLPEPNAMTIATATSDGHPSARMVLLKEHGEEGFVFFTNYESRKGDEILANPHAALVFFWQTFHRQIRIEGTVERVSPAESDAYFETRAPASQIGASASRQSRTIESRAVLETEVQALTERYADSEVPRPPYWGGFRVRPQVIEFWQGRPNRLHDRLRYYRTVSGWARDRLSP
jgi:pyridoxamine 5'-phosphate oxidase